MARSCLNGFEAPLRVVLQPSRLLYGLTTSFALCCASAISYVLTPRYGIHVGIYSACAVAWMVLRTARHDTEKHPAAIEIGPAGLTTWHQTGEPIRDMKLCSTYFWDTLLLGIKLQDSAQRMWRIWLLADTLPRETLRELRVRLTVYLRSAAGPNKYSQTHLI